MNRGSASSQVFHKTGDYYAFLDAIHAVTVRLPLLAYCLLFNHFHLVVRPIADGDLSGGMHWLMTTHLRRYLKHYGHSGHIWQGRFKAFPTQDDKHLITLVCDFERNPLWGAGRPRGGLAMVEPRRVDKGRHRAPAPHCKG